MPQYKKSHPPGSDVQTHTPGSIWFFTVCQMSIEAYDMMFRGAGACDVLNKIYFLRCSPSNFYFSFSQLCIVLSV